MTWWISHVDADPHACIVCHSVSNLCFHIDIASETAIGLCDFAVYLTLSTQDFFYQSLTHSTGTAFQCFLRTLGTAVPVVVIPQRPQPLVSMYPHARITHRRLTRLAFGFERYPTFIYIYITGDFRLGFLTSWALYTDKRFRFSHCPASVSTRL